MEEKQQQSSAVKRGWTASIACEQLVSMVGGKPSMATTSGLLVSIAGGEPPAKKKTCRLSKSSLATLSNAARLAALDAERKWKAEPITVNTLPFNGVPGPINCPPKLTPLDAFRIIFPIDLLQHIVDNTNETAKVNNNKHGLSGGKVTMHQVCTYVSILMAMSINKKPALDDHWSQDLLFCTPWIQDKMPRDMWLAIHKALHFDIIKVEPGVREASRKHWYPSRNVCIDEGIGPWQGKKKGVCVFILGKPHPNGIKLYILADENGYVYDFWIYRGTQKTIPEIVMDFVKLLPGT